MLSTRFKVFVIAVLMLMCSKNQALATKDEIYRFRPGFHLSREHQLKNDQLDTLLQGFRLLTGLKGIGADEDGNIVLGDRSQFDGGSPTARALLFTAVDSGDSFTISSFENSQAIAFAQIESRDTYNDGQGGKFTRWEIRLDFSDFKQLNGSTEAKRTFDPAINVAHELTHAIHGFDDAINGEDRVGECERFINKMRAELGLPQRTEYFPFYRMTSRPNGSTFIQAELGFADSAGGVYLSFEVDQVFDRSKARSKADVLATMLSRRKQK